MHKLLLNTRYVSKLVLLLILITLGGFFFVNGNSAEPADWGDIVDINYSLWEDEEHTIEVLGNIDINLSLIYLSLGTTVPQEVLQKFPGATAGLLLKFKEALVGMAENETKDFKINSTDTGTIDQYYRVVLLKIQFDSSSIVTSTTDIDPSTETTTTTESEDSSSTTTSSISNLINTTSTSVTTDTKPKLTTGISTVVSIFFIILIVVLRRRT